MENYFLEGMKKGSLKLALYVVKTATLLREVCLTGAFPPSHVRREKDLKATDERYTTNRVARSARSGGSRTWEEQERKRDGDRFT